MFNVKVNDGFAPMAWQAWVGPTVLYRADGDITKGDVHVLCDFVTRLMDKYSAGVVLVTLLPARDITPRALDSCQCISQSRSIPGTRKEPLTLQHTSEQQDLEARVGSLRVA
jgi:hypothetical protein